ncbi:MAG TPA: prepilin-type N-terminal cleavage/methylation domain-containing protein [Fimbriiglobus sp.]|nr:prepilin-type N-terminal cleavage/methylation domain-containing protein [Fimbriiglobus sp.]
MTYTHTRRGGFTLVEMMVVILLIVILAALSAGAFYKIQAAQRVGATEATIRKVQINMDARWKAVLDEARRSLPDAVVTLAGNDKERALSIWTYAKLKNEFPQTFAEVAPIILPTSPPIVLQPRAVFAPVVAATPAETDVRMQSAALIYAALTATGAGGASGDLDGLNQQVGTTPTGRQAFMDNWGMPLAFVRWADTPEVQAEPFNRPNIIRSRSLPNGFPVSNPLDPAGKLLFRPDNDWGTAPGLQPLRTELLAQFYQGENRTQFPNVNFVPTLVSAGPDKEFGADVYGANSGDPGSDNVVGYRLRREGAKGN